MHLSRPEDARRRRPEPRWCVKRRVVLLVGSSCMLRPYPRYAPGGLPWPITYPNPAKVIRRVIRTDTSLPETMTETDLHAYALERELRDARDRVGTLSRRCGLPAGCCSPTWRAMAGSQRSVACGCPASGTLSSRTPRG